MTTKPTLQKGQRGTLQTEENDQNIQKSTGESKNVCASSSLLIYYELESPWEKLISTGESAPYFPVALSL